MYPLSSCVVQAILCYGNIDNHICFNNSKITSHTIIAQFSSKLFWFGRALPRKRFDLVLIDYVWIPFLPSFYRASNWITKKNIVGIVSIDKEEFQERWKAKHQEGWVMRSQPTVNSPRQFLLHRCIKDHATTAIQTFLFPFPPYWLVVTVAHMGWIKDLHRLVRIL